jgi:serine/threonine-protein kinase
LIVILVLGVLGVLLWLFAREILGGAPEEQTTQTVTVPAVEGEALRDAQQALEAVDLEWIIVQRVPDPDAAPGTVLDQNPDAGARVEPGTEVELTVAKAATAEIPTGLAGQPEQDVLDTLAALDFTNVTTEPQESTLEEGLVIGTEPPEGTADVALDDPIVVFVSSGTGTARVPDITCLSYGQAKSELAAAGFGINPAGEEPPNPLCPNGSKIVRQDPEGNTDQPSGTVVQVWVAGDEPTESPSPSPT